MILETLLPQLEFQSNIEDAVKQKMIKSRRQVEGSQQPPTVATILIFCYASECH